MAVEASHVKITEFTKETLPYINWMIEDLFCRYGVSMPYFLLDFEFPDYSARPNIVEPYEAQYPEIYKSEWSPMPFPDWQTKPWPTWVPSTWPDWLPITGYGFNMEGDYFLTWFNELLGLLFDEAELPRWSLPDYSPASINMLNNQITTLYDNVSVEEELEQVGSWRITRTGQAYSYAGAESDYTDDPSYTITEDPAREAWVRWWEASIGGTPTEYIVSAWQTYIKFDTTAISSVTSAKLVVSVAWFTDGVNLYNTDENPLMYIYKHNFSELLTNEDMEDINSWTNRGSPTTNERSDEQANGGTYSRKIVTDATGEGSYQDITTEVGEDYDISGYIYVSSGNAKMGKEDTDGSDQSLSSQATLAAWTEFTLSFTATETTSRIFFQSDTEAASTFYVDDMSVVKTGDGDAPDENDWSGGTKIAEREFTTADRLTDVEITIPTSSITIEGYTKFRFSLERIPTSTFWESPPAGHLVGGTTAILVLQS